MVSCTGKPVHNLVEVKGKSEVSQACLHRRRTISCTGKPVHGSVEVTVKNKIASCCIVFV